MPICVAVPKELFTHERRVALVPETVTRLTKQNISVLIEKDAGQQAHYLNDAYQGTEICEANDLYQKATVFLKVQPPSVEEIEKLKSGDIIIGFMSPHNHLDLVAKMRDKNITSFAMELIPRISRAQSMDALSSQAAIAGYKAVLMAAQMASIFFPMLTTAAGTIRPAKVLVIGAGVAGLQAIATAKRLGAMIEGYDIRPETKEQIESLGAKFVNVGVDAKGEGGYARELTEEEKQQQRDVLAKHVAAANVVITTAAIPGRPSPKILPTDMVEQMAPGSVIIDIAAEGGGNCELSQPGETIVHNDITIHAPLNVPSQMPTHASEMYSKNMFNFLSPMLKEGELAINWEDEIIAGSVLTHDGEIKHSATQTLMEQQGGNA